DDRSGDPLRSGRLVVRGPLLRPQPDQRDQRGQRDGDDDADRDPAGGGGTGRGPGVGVVGVVGAHRGDGLLATADETRATDRAPAPPAVYGRRERTPPGPATIDGLRASRRTTVFERCEPSRDTRLSVAIVIRTSHDACARAVSFASGRVDTAR